MNKTLFVASGHYSWGSARMRCYWPANYMDAEVIHGQLGSELWYLADCYENFIFQKSGQVDIFQYLHSLEKKVIVDLCDPLHWFNPEWVRAAVPYVEHWTVSSPGLQYDLRNFDPAIEAHLIPDAIEPSHFQRRRQHCETRPVRLIWFGHHANRVSLPGAVVVLNRLAANGYPFELTIFDDRPETPTMLSTNFRTQHIRWELVREIELLAGHDIALLPPYPGPWGKMKSNNKMVTAQACGLPVVSGYDYAELAALLDSWELRAAQVPGRDFFQPYLAENVARQWEVLL